jgi:hypothetical protein
MLDLRPRTASFKWFRADRETAPTTMFLPISKDSTASTATYTFLVAIVLCGMLLISKILTGYDENGNQWLLANDCVRKLFLTGES